MSNRENANRLSWHTTDPLGVYSSMNLASRLRLLLPYIAGVLWLAAVGYGFSLAMKFELTPGAAGNPKNHWPAGSKIAPDSGIPNLVVALHPRCSCSRASLHELAEVV